MKISGFKQEKVLGEGSYGKVYKTRRLNDNQIYAIKAIDLNKLDYKEIEDAVNEIRLMASVTSPFIISFYEAFAVEDQKRLYIVTEYAKIGDLRHLIERRKLRNLPLQEEQIWQFLLEILEGLRILHSCGVVHRDLKSANILISAPDLVKIGDLGIATVLHNHKTAFAKEMARTQIGTPLYIAPEVWKNRPYDQKCDIWSLGVLLYEMMTFSFPFMGRNQDDLQRRVCAGAYTVPKYIEKLYSRDLLSILRQLLMVDPKDRPSVDEILNMQSVKSHMDLLNPFLQSDLYRNTSLNEISMEGGHAKLLSTIHVPKANYDRYGRKNINLDNVQLPSQKYNKRPPVIKPIAERMHMKKGIPIPPSLDIATISTPDLTLITDQDLWSPIKEQESCFSKSDDLNHNQDIQTNNTYPPSNPVSKKQPKQVQFVNQAPQPSVSQENRMNQGNVVKKNEVSFASPLKPSPRKPLPPITDQYIEPQIQQQPLQHMEDQIQLAPAQQPKISPRMIPSRYKNLYKPCQNPQDKQYQDPRWRRRQPSPQKPREQPVANNNNIFNKQQQDVPWWYGQELQQQPMQPLPIQQRKHPVVAINPRFRRIGKY